MLTNQITDRRFTGNTLVYFIVGLVVLVLAFLVIDNYLLTNEPELVAEQAILPVVEPAETINEMDADEIDTVLHNSVAVLIFNNLSPNPDDAYLTMGFHQDLLFLLAQIEDMSVIAHNGVFNTDISYTNKDIVGEAKFPSDMPIDEIASNLNVGAIMKGSVLYEDNIINVDVQLFNAADNNELWSETYERDLADIFTIQAEIVEQIAMAVGANVSEAEKARIHKPLANSIEAYKLYLKGRTVVSHIEAGMPPKFYQYMDEAIAADPDFALAHALKATAYGIAHTFANPNRLSSLAEEEKIAAAHTEKALALDPNLCFAHMAQALIHFINGRNVEANQAYERALQLGPNVTVILDGYAHFLSVIEEHDKAVQMAGRAQALTPNDASWHARLGSPLTFGGRSDEAAYQFRQGLKYYEFPWLYRMLGIAEYLSGNKDESIKAIRTAEQIQTEVGRGPDMMVAYTYSRLGLSEDAARLVNEYETRIAKGQSVSITNSTLMNLAIGNTDEAYDALSQDPNGGLVSLQYIKSNVMSDPVMDEPRFVELRNRIGSSN